MASFGDTLKRERELRDITLREISDATKINIRYLEALEQNRFESLPGGLFNKGFIRAYSTYIGVDGETMVNCYLQEIAGRKPSAAAFAGDTPPGVLRPSESPKRRAEPHEDQGSNGRPLKITFGTPSAEAGPARATPVSPTAVPRLVPAVDRGPAARADDRAPDSQPRAVTHIEDAGEPAVPSRVLPAILTLTGVAAACFVVLALIFGRAHSNGQATSSGAKIENPAQPVTIGAETQKQGSGAQEPPTDLAGVTAVIGGSSPAGVTLPAGGPAPAPRPAATPQPKAVTAHPAPPGSVPAEAAAPPRVQAQPGDSGPMEIQVETTRTSWVQLFCDDREEINWVMKEGESDALRCLRLVRVSAADAAAVRLRVNGSPCVSLGEAGSRVHGFTIRSDDFRQICPPGAARGDDGRH
jgi:Helix-turn-helix domain